MLVELWPIDPNIDPITYLSMHGTYLLHMLRYAYHYEQQYATINVINCFSFSFQLSKLHSLLITYISIHLFINFMFSIMYSSSSNNEDEVIESNNPKVPTTSRAIIASSDFGSGSSVFLGNFHIFIFCPNSIHLFGGTK